MAKKLVFAIIILISSLLGFSQNPTQDSIVPKKKPISPTRPIDSTFVTYNAYQFDSIFLNSSKVIDTLTFHVASFDVLESRKTIYSSLSNFGLAHKSMRFNNLRPTGFDMTLPAFSATIKNESNLIAYQSVLPYSELRYLMSVMDKELHLNAKFGRQFTPRLFVSFEFNTDLSPGTFKNTRILNNYFWINAHYFTKNKRYGISAYWYRNKLEMQENGGIVNDEDYTSNADDNSVINVNLTTASNFIVSSGIGFQQYFNLLPQKKIIKAESTPVENDTIAPLADSLLIDSLVVDTLSMDSLPHPETQEVIVQQKVRRIAGRAINN